MSFNPNELVLERIRSVEEYDVATKELIGRYTQIESPSLKTAAEGTTVTDAMGAEITTFYKAQTGTFDFTNSVFSLDLAASQFGSKKEVAEGENTFVRPVTETIVIGNDHTVNLKYTPVGEAGAEIKTIKIINENNEFGDTYNVTADETPAGKTFRLNTSDRVITLPDDVTGSVFVRYDAEVKNTVKITKRTDSLPAVRSLLVHAIFHDPCDINKVYAGMISIPRAQIDPSAVEVSLTPDGKHAASYKLQKAYCDDSAKLFDIIVSQD